MERDDSCVGQSNFTLVDYVYDPDTGRLLKRIDKNLQIVSSGIGNIDYDPDDYLERKY